MSAPRSRESVGAWAFGQPPIKQRVHLVLSRVWMIATQRLPAKGDTRGPEIYRGVESLDELTLGGHKRSVANPASPLRLIHDHAAGARHATGAELAGDFVDAEGLISALARTSCGRRQWMSGRHWKPFASG